MFLLSACLFLGISWLGDVWLWFSVSWSLAVWCQPSPSCVTQCYSGWVKRDMGEQIRGVIMGLMQLPSALKNRVLELFVLQELLSSYILLRLQEYTYLVTVIWE